MAAGAVKGITIQFLGDTTKLQKSIREIDSSTRKLDKELKQVDRALKFNPRSIDLWRQKQTILSQKVTDTKRKLDRLKEAQKRMDAKGVDKNSAEYRKLQREIITTESKLKHFKAEVKKLGNVKLRALGEQMKGIGSKMTGLGRTMSMYVTAPLVAGGTIAAKKFAEVDKTMQLTNSTMGNTAEEAGLLNGAMKSAAAASTYGMTDAATATLNFARAGLSAKEAADALAPAMALAAGEGGELDTVSAGLVATINGFHGSFDQAGKYADVFANACNNSALDVNSLSTAMSIAAPIFASAGYSVEDAALYMGVMANNGIEANKAANSLKTGLARLVSPAKQGAEMMDELGISVTNSDGTMKNSIEIQKELHDRFAKLSESEQIAAASAIFGKNQMAPWLALINTAPKDVDSLSSSLTKNGTAMEMQSSMMSGFGGQIEQLKSGLDVLAYSLGEALAPTISKIVGFVQSLVNWFNSLSPQMQQIIAIVGVVVAALGPLLIIVGALVTAIGNLIVFGPIILGVLGGLAAPIAGVIAVIAGLIAVGVLLYKNWDKIKAKAIEIKNKVVKTWSDMKTRVVTTFNSVRTRVAAIVDGIKSKVSGAFNTLKTTVSTIWGKIRDAITKPIRKAKDVVDGVVQKLKDLFPIDVGNIFKNIKTPHFSWSWKEVGKTGFKIPTINKPEWYAKAMQTGRILKGATIFGQDSNGRFLGGGEAGTEVVSGANSLSNMISSSVAHGLGMAAGEIARAVATSVSLAMAGQGGQQVIEVYLYKNGPQMGRYTVDTYNTWSGRLGKK